MRWKPSIGLLAAALSVGCGAPPADIPKSELYPVSGFINVDGKPVNGAHVTCHPVDSSSLGSVTPNGVTDENGLFVLTTYKPEDGAPEGKYQVTVSWSDIKNPGASDPEYGPEKLPKRYQAKEASKLEIEVKSGETNSPFLDLASR